MPKRSEDEHSFSQTDIPLFGMNGIQVEANTVLKFLEQTESYPLPGLVFQLTSGLLSIEEFVDEFVIPQDREYQQIESYAHSSDTVEDSRRLNARLERRRTALIQEYQEKYASVPHGLLFLLREHIVLSDSQVKHLSQLEGEPIVVPSPFTWM